MLEKLLNESGGVLETIVPKGGVTCFVRYNLEIDSVDFCAGLIKKYNTLLVPGSVYGAERYFRVGFGVNSKIFQIGLKNLHQYLKNLV